MDNYRQTNDKLHSAHCHPLTADCPNCDCLARVVATFAPNSYVILVATLALDYKIGGNRQNRNFCKQ